MARFGNLIGRVLGLRTERTPPPAQSSADERVHSESRTPTEAEIDEALDESFPASDPIALRLEKH